MPIKKKKSMSFGKIVGLTLGGIVGLMVLGYAIIQGIYGNKSATGRTPMPMANTATVQPTVAPPPVVPQTIGIPEGPKSEEIVAANSETRAAITALSENLNAVQEQNIQVLTLHKAELERIQTQLNQLMAAQQMKAEAAILERKVEVVKPESKTNVQIAPPMTEYNGLPVTAVVGDTIWVKPSPDAEPIPVRFGRTISTK